jgi:ATP-binding protein involved in chromosome partitioning
VWDRIKKAMAGSGEETTKAGTGKAGTPSSQPDRLPASIAAAIDEVVDPRSGGLISASGLLSEPLFSDGKLILTLTVPPDDVARYQPVRDALEKVLSAIPEVRQALVVLSAEAPAGRVVPESRVKPEARPKSGAASHRTPAAAPAPKAQRVGGIDFSHIGAIVAVASGKGGVGKSTTTANLAIAMKRQGLAVGVLDADVYGPSIPRLFGVSAPPVFGDDKKAEPPVGHGVRVMSMGFLIEEGTPMVWRAPMVVSALRQMLSDVAWASPDTPLDVLLIDMPPGTGDTQLTISQIVPLDGAVIVSTPQDLALIDARKGVAMFEKVEVPILGIVENMSTFVCPACGHEAHIFGHGGAESDARRIGVPFLGAVPLHMAIRETSDAGTPIATVDADGPQAGIYATIAGYLWADIVARKAGRRAPPAIIIEDEL